MKGLSWNCRGLNDQLAPTIPKARAILSSSYFDFVFLSETKCSISFVDPLFRHLGFCHSLGIDAQGTKGGLWLGFRDPSVFSCIYVCQNFIIVKTKQCSVRCWYLCLVYGEPKTHLRGDVWNELSTWMDTFSDPFLLLGHFNQIEYQIDKWGGRVGVIDGVQCFRKWKTQHCLMDIPFKGPKFTWCNNRGLGKRINERLDKGYGSPNWQVLFPNTGILHFPIQISYHAPIIFDSDLIRSSGRRPYKIEAWNFNYPECLQFIRGNWQRSWYGCQVTILGKKLNLTKNVMRIWSLNKRKEWNKQWTDFDKDLTSAMDDAVQSGDHSTFDALRSGVTEYSRNLAVYWKQRAKLKWATEGDTCSKYFFNCVKARAGKNHIFGIESIHGDWFFERNEIEDSLGSLFTKKEVRKAVFHLGSLKSPGPDGFPALFYQWCWHFIKHDVVSAVLQTLNSGEVPRQWNKTFITLIPKCTNPEGVDNYRPISLCNVIMKIVTKCITNTLKGFMGKLVGPFQNAFVPGRCITDNILISHEIIHNISVSSGKLPRMAFKADMSKAYDRLDWNFIKMTLMKMEFPDNLITLIMNCITTVSYEILINGVPTSSVEPRCGLTQGDPLSPYLFVLCTELLSQNIQKTTTMKTLRGVSLSRGGMAISHLLFVDDSVFFVESNKTGCEVLSDILCNYCKTSGQFINQAKSALLISPSSTMAFAKACMGLFKAPVSNSLGIYLGLPSDVSNSLEKTSKRCIFNFLIEKVEKRISAWNGLLLSPAGRLMLISSVLSSLSIYFLSVFKMSCLGGLGIRNTRCLNQALLAKTAWRIISEPNSLIHLTLGRKYGFQQSVFCTTTRVKRPSASWGGRSIDWGMDLIWEDCAWRLGSDCKLNVWSTKWVDGESPIPKDPAMLQGEPNLINLQVRHLINDSLFCWNEECILSYFHISWARRILAIPLPVRRVDDYLYWKGSKTASYMVKAAYFRAKQNHWNLNASTKDLTRLGPEYRCFVQKKLWNLPGPKVWSILLWKILTDTLPIGCELARRNIQTYCTSCSLDDSCDAVETLEHLFRDCHVASRLWMGSVLGIRVDNCAFINVKIWIMNWFLFLLKDKDNCYGVTSFLCTLWTIWKVRNINLFKASKD
ncbi:uncharacterized protein LOC141587836 [Silene latifolia]|uniref:uncharacterized protein LOC141587836 n=1 Tax=Silene latifolia TaxID=37657 RepID=UPI003D76CED5